MAFTVRSLEFLNTDRARANDSTVRATGGDGPAATAEIIRAVEQGQGFLLGGPQGCGKTSLLNEVAFHFNSRAKNVIALGPLSLRRIAQDGLESLGAQLSDWLKDHETRIPHANPADQPTDANSLKAWLPFLKKLIRQRKAKTLLLLLDDLDSVPTEARQATLQAIQNCPWAKVANRFVLGCAERVLDDAVAAIVKRQTAIDLYMALAVNLGGVPVYGSKAKKGGGKGFGTSESIYNERSSHLVGDNAIVIAPLKPAIEEDVDATVYAPGQAAPGNSFLVRVWVHLPEQTEGLEEKSKESEPEAKRRESTTLPKKIQRGKSLTFNLTMPELIIAKPSQSLVWRGERDSVRFSVQVPKDLKPRTLTGIVEVCESSVPIGDLMFQFKIVAEATTPSTEPDPVGVLVLYKQAFISYSSTDRLEVLKRVQMLDALGPKYFMDQVNLTPGAKWEREIYRYLDESDVVYVFWSKAASSSRWVAKELEYARKRQGGDDDALPRIVPIPIEGPPAAKPPKKLSYLHFSDKFLYFIKGEEGKAKSRPGKKRRKSKDPS